MERGTVIKLGGWIACGLAVVAVAHGQESVVPRAGKPGPRMLLGTSVMDPAQNRLVKSLGFSHAQTDSDHLTVNETAPGHWDWTNADAGLAAMQSAGMKWQYFPHFHWPPEWYRKSTNFVPSIGLRSQRKLAAMSIWSPDIVPWFDHCYSALAAHYGSGNDKVYALYLGIHGDFGETIFPMGWHPDETNRFGTNGAGMADFWCGDEFARKSFRCRACAKYGPIAKINAAWGTDFTNIAHIDYPPGAYKPDADVISTPEARRYWLDFVEWYYNGMTRFTGEVCRIARHYFPEALLEIPVGGGNENLVYGQDTTALPKIAKEYGVHIRSTHGGYAPFPQGYAGMIKRIATPCKYYGVPHWLEPPGGITPENEVGRIMEALSCGNYGFWDWGSNPVGATNVFREYTNFFTREKPVVDAALFFPTTDHRLHPAIDFPRQLQSVGAQLRDKMDFDMVDEELIADGGLKPCRVLVWIEGQFIEQGTLKTIAAWIERGGVLVHRGAQPPETVEGGTDLGSSLLGNRLDSNARALAAVAGRPAIWALPRGKGWVIVADGAKEAEFQGAVLEAAYHLSRLDPTRKDALEVNPEPGVYATRLANDEVVFYNANNATTTNRGVGAASPLVLPPHSLRSVSIKRAN